MAELECYDPEQDFTETLEVDEPVEEERIEVTEVLEHVEPDSQWIGNGDVDYIEYVMDSAVDQEPEKVLKLEPEKLMEMGNAAIQKNLEAKMDDYLDKGMDQEAIMEQLAIDKKALEAEFMEDAFGVQSNLEDDDNIYDVTEVNEVPRWLNEINPNYDPFDFESPYSNNCGSCAFAVAQRLDGDVNAVAGEENISTIEEMNALTGMEQVAMRPEDIRERLIEMGPGGHAIVGVDRVEGPGHWFNALCLDGNKVVALDGQTGEISDWPPDYGDVAKWDMSIEKGETK